MEKSIYILLSCLLVATVAVVQELKFYSEKDMQGDGIVLRNNYPDLSAWRNFLQNASSVCITGWWNMYIMPNYDESGAQMGWSFHENEYCFNRSDFGRFGSARHYGPRDTETVAIAFYEDTHQQPGNSIYREHIVDGNVGYDFPFTPKSFKTFGRSNWTLFTENMFEGNSICHRSTNMVEHVQLNTTHGTGFSFRSVIRGCYVRGTEIQTDMRG